MVNLRAACGAAALSICGLGWVAVQAQQNPADVVGRGEESGIAGPSHQTVMTPFVLPGLQSDLGLSAGQVTQLLELKQEMLAKGKAFSNQIAAKRKELDRLIGPGTSKSDVVKKLFQQIGSLKGQQQFTAYETTIRMNAVLTDSQRAKLTAMKSHDFRQTMMARMTMTDMTELMQFMGGGTMDGVMIGQMTPLESLPGASPKQ